MKDATQRKIGIILSYLNMVISILISIVYTPFMFKHLAGGGESATIQYGLQSFAVSLTSWFGLLSTALASSYIRFATIEEKNDGENGVNKLNGVYFTFFSICAVIFLVGSAFLLSLIVTGIIPLKDYDEPSKKILFIIMGINIATTTVSTPFILINCFLSYKQQFLWKNLIPLVMNVVVHLINIPLLLGSAGIVSLQIITALSSILTLVLNCFYTFFVLKAKIQLINNDTFKCVFSAVAKFSAILLFNTIVDQIESVIDKNILGFEANAKYVAIYAIGMSLNAYMVTAAYAFSNVFAPTFNRLVVDDDWNGINKLFCRISNIELLIIFTIIGGFVSCGKEFVMLWAGADKAEAYIVTITLMILVSFALASNPAIEIQRAANKVKFRAIAYSIGAIVNVAISIILVKLLPIEYCIYGCLGGTVISSIGAKWIAMSIYNNKIGIDMKSFIFRYCKYFLSTGVAVAITVAISQVLPHFSWPWTSVLIKGVIFVVIYSPFVLLLNEETVVSFTKKKLFSKQ